MGICKIDHRGDKMIPQIQFVESAYLLGTYPELYRVCPVCDHSFEYPYNDMNFDIKLTMLECKQKIVKAKL